MTRATGKPRTTTFKKGQIANPNGRPVGSKNKVQLIAKEVIADAAARLGGAEGLAKWAMKTNKNRSIFWSSIYPRLLPVQVTGANGGPMQLEVSAHAMADRFAEEISQLVVKLHKAPDPPTIDVTPTPKIRLVEDMAKRKVAR
jgi:hypothetical protein